MSGPRQVTKLAVGYGRGLHFLVSRGRKVQAAKGGVVAGFEEKWAPELGLVLMHKYCAETGSMRKWMSSTQTRWLLIEIIGQWEYSPTPYSGGSGPQGGSIR